MIPETTAGLDDLLAEIERQDHEMADLFEEVSEEGARWRPDATTWSMTAHLDHVCLVNQGYVDTLEEVVSEARESGVSESEGPFRHPWISRRFVRTLEPPPGFRVKTFPSLVPATGVDPDEALPRFLELQSRLARTIDRARGLDLAGTRLRSPVLRFLPLSLGAGFEAVLAHNRRHVWLMREVMEKNGFPG